MNTQNLTIDLNSKRLSLNDLNFDAPYEVTKLSEILGAARFTEKTSEDGNNFFTWDEWGIFLFSKDGITGETIAICFTRPDWYDGAEFFPEKLFTSDLKINGQELETYLKPIKEDLEPWGHAIKIGRNNLYINVDDNKSVYSIQFKQAVKPIKKTDNKYAFKKSNGDKLKFTDFNFKLAVIQVLMYEKELLTPKFDVEEFASLYTKREINIDSEGYDFIPEVRTYFEKLEIDVKFAKEITEMYLDAGNDIYGHLICFWDGEDDVFDIKSIADVTQFANLKKITTIFGLNKINIKKLESFGIEVIDL